MKNYSQKMKIWPEEEVLSGGYFFDEFDPDLISSLLEELKLENCHIKFLTKKLENCLDEIEPIYGTPYSFKDISEETLMLFDDPKLENFEEPLKEKIEKMGYPPQNPYFPTSIDIIQKEQ